MSTFFPAGGPGGKPGAWWRVVHSAVEAGADLSALRLVHIAGGPVSSEEISAQMEERLGQDAACMCYDASSLLIIEPGVSDAEVMEATCDLLNVSPEQVRLWAANELLDNGLKFTPVPDTMIAHAHTASSAQSNKGTDIILTDAEFTYFPLWDIHASEIFGYVCEAVWGTETGERVPEESLNAFFMKTRYVLALDREALHKSVYQAQDFLDRYMFANIVIPVHYSTIADPLLRASYMDAVNEGIWAVMDNVYFEITKIPNDADGAVLIQAIDDLGPCGRGILLRVEKGFENFAIFPADLIVSVGLDFHYDVRPPAEIQAELKTFSAVSQQFGLRCHAHSLKEMETCVAATELDFAYISSSIIAPPLDLSNPEEEMATPPEVLRAMLRGKK